MEKKRIGVGMIGYGFMGKAHTTAFRKLPTLYSSEAVPVLKGICGRTSDKVREVAEKFGYEYSTTEWGKLIKDPEIQIIDNCGPDRIHQEPCIAALESGKHTLVEKPMAMNLKEALQMYEPANKAQQKGVKHMVCFNYRFAPAILLAKRLINEGWLGKIYHFRANFLQDRLVDPDYPLTWRLRKATSSSGTHGDLNSHSVDMARFLVGEVSRVCAWTKIFIKERPLPDTMLKQGQKVKGKVDVPDVACVWLEFENGAMGSLEASRFNTGCKGAWRIEIHGSKGAVMFNLARMNELKFYSRKDPSYAQGFRTIFVTDPKEHEFIKYWWPKGQMLAWEHCHYNAILHFFDCIVHNKTIAPPGATFFDGLRCQEILEAGLVSAEEGRWVQLDELRCEYKKRDSMSGTVKDGI